MSWQKLILQQNIYFLLSLSGKELKKKHSLNSINSTSVIQQCRKKTYLNVANKKTVLNSQYSRIVYCIGATQQLLISAAEWISTNFCNAWRPDQLNKHDVSSSPGNAQSMKKGSCIKKSYFLSGPATKAFSPSPSA